MSPLTTPPRLTGLAALLACGALAAPAQGAFAPRLAVQVDPPTAGAPTAVTLDLAQAAGEEATRSVRVALPGFGPASGARARAACPGPAPCAAESRIGAATASTSFGTFAGGVFFAGAEGDRTRLSVVLSNPAVPLVLDQRFTGTLTPAAGGGVELAFDDLPGATATRLRIALDGGERALVTAPGACGAYDLIGRLTSHGGQSAQQTSRVAIGGCAGGAPVVSTPRLTPSRLRAGRATTLGFTLSEPAFARVTARRAGTRRVRTLRRMDARGGRNVARGLARDLPPGLWLLTVTAFDADGRSARTVALRVLR